MDGDDMPDSWESLFPTACSPLRFRPNLDPDGDGWDTTSEYMAYYLHPQRDDLRGPTNEDGEVSSNMTSGVGFKVPYCDPDDARSYPKPDITFRFKTDCPEVEGTLRIWAYMEPEMNCPDAMTSEELEAPIRDGNFLNLTDWMDGGHIAPGPDYFMAFIDVDDDGHGTRRSRWVSANTLRTTSAGRSHGRHRPAGAGGGLCAHRLGSGERRFERHGNRDLQRARLRGGHDRLRDDPRRLLGEPQLPA
jgi:hypothetical protein